MFIFQLFILRILFCLTSTSSLLPPLRASEAPQTRLTPRLQHSPPAPQEENEVPDEETVNQMIARSEEELQIYQQLDLDRRRDEARLGPARKPRLIEESELPEWLLRDEAEIDELTHEDDDSGLFGRGSRARKTVDYTDQLNDRNWLRAIGVSSGAGGGVGGRVCELCGVVSLLAYFVAKRMRNNF